MDWLDKIILLYLFVIFKEDDCRIRDETPALNFTWFCKMALSFLKPVEEFGKSVHSIKNKMLQNWARPESILEYINPQMAEVQLQYLSGKIDEQFLQKINANIKN